jgi:hypothetical protein
MSKRSLPAILSGRASNSREYVIAIRAAGPSWEVRKTPSGEWVCKCPGYWQSGECMDVTAARQWEARQARTSPIGEPPAEGGSDAG